MRRPFYRCLPSAQAGSDLVFLQILLLSPVNDLVQGLVGMRIKPRPNVELFTRRTKLSEFSRTSEDRLRDQRRSLHATN